jgi:signal transduction histidine kinase/integral membrane sensor domain MASE1
VVVTLIAMKRQLSPLAAMVILALVYFCTGKLGLLLAFGSTNATAVWPPTGIALAAVLLWGYRVWPGIFLGAFWLNFTTATPFWAAFGIGLGNTLEALLGAWLVNRYARGKEAFDQPKSILKFVILAGVVSTTVSATIGTTSLALSGLARGNSHDIWMTWWVGDLVSDIVMASLLLIWSAKPYPQWKAVQIPEALLLMGSVLLVGQAVFGGWFISRGYSTFEYLAIPPLLWAAWRFGLHGASAAALMMSVIAILGTLHGFGPFITRQPEQSLRMLQLFMGTASLTALVLAAVVAQRNRAVNRLNMQYDVERLLTESATPAEAIQKILQIVCRSLEWERGTTWWVDPSANVLRAAEMWHQRATKAVEFETITRTMTFQPGVGLPGRVWASGRPVWISDVVRDGNLPRKVMAAAGALHGGFGFPILVGNKILGVMEFFSQRNRQPDGDFIDAFTAMGGQIGQFIERKHAEEQLRESQSRLRFALEAGQLGDWDLDLITHRTVRSLLHDRIFGYETLLPEWTYEIGLEHVHPEDRPVFDATFKHSLATGEDWESECRIIRKDQSTGWIWTRGSFYYDPSGNPIRCLGVVKDITERKRAEHDLQAGKEQLAQHAQTLERRVAERTASLEETIRSLEGVLYHIAHDLRAPLRTLAGFTQLLVEAVGPHLDESTTASAERIIAATKQMDRLILDLLAYGRLGHLRPSFRRVALVEQIEGVLLQMAAEVKARNAKVQLVEPMPAVRADPALLSQALTQLVRNAMTFVAPGVVPQVRLWAERREGMVRLWVQDNGIGIEPEYWERIFRVFERLHRANEYTGTGIGLAIVRKGMERMGGSVGLESRPGEGSRFWLELQGEAEGPKSQDQDQMR